MKNYFVIIIAFLFHCCVSRNRECFRNTIINNRFYSTKDNNRENYLIFKNDTLFEYVDGRLKFGDNIIWKSCSRYFVVPSNNSEDGFWKKNDTLIVDIISHQKDTVYLIATSMGKSVPMKFVKF